MAGFVQSLKGLNAVQLMEKKEAIERDIKEFSEVLQTVSQVLSMSGSKVTFCYMQQAGVGMTGPLVDEEGFPRSDIDVYAVRTARNRVICECVCARACTRMMSP